MGRCCASCLLAVLLLSGCAAETISRVSFEPTRSHQEIIGLLREMQQELRCQRAQAECPKP